MWGGLWNFWWRSWQVEALSQQEQEPLPDFWFLHTRRADSPTASNTNINIIQLCMFIFRKPNFTIIQLKRRDMPSACFNSRYGPHQKHAKGMSLRYDAISVHLHKALQQELDGKRHEPCHDALPYDHRPGVTVAQLMAHGGDSCHAWGVEQAEHKQGVG